MCGVPIQQTRMMNLIEPCYNSNTVNTKNTTQIVKSSTLLFGLKHFNLQQQQRAHWKEPTSWMWRLKHCMINQLIIQSINQISPSSL